MEHALVMSGIGGQGIIVGTKLIGHAATRIGKYCLHYAQYGGEMRGTKCECTMSISDEPVTAPPLISQPDIAIIMHPESFAPLAKALAPGGLALINASLITPEFIADPARFAPRLPTTSASGVVNKSATRPQDYSNEQAELRSDIEWLLLPLTDAAKAIGHVMVATMVAIGAFAEETGLIQVDHVRSALTDIIPPYRHQLLEMDSDGLSTGQRLADRQRQEVVGRGPAGELDLRAIPQTRNDVGVRIPSILPYRFARTALSVAT